MFFYLTEIRLTKQHVCATGCFFVRLKVTIYIGPLAVNMVLLSFTWSKKSTDLLAHKVWRIKLFPFFKLDIII